MLENENVIGSEQTGESSKARKQWRAPEMTIAPISATETGPLLGADGSGSATS